MTTAVPVAYRSTATPVGRSKSEDSGRLTSRATHPELELPDPLAVAADTDLQNRLFLLMGELEGARPQFSTPTTADQLAAAVSAAAYWVSRTGDLLSTAVPPEASNAVVAEAVAAAGQFLTEARELGERRGGWKTGFGLFDRKPAGGSAARVRLLATTPDVFDHLLAAFTPGFTLPSFATLWATTAATFVKELRRELAWTTSGTN
jgi:hypothetical protein